MSQYPEDEFDRIEPTGRRGAHRRDTGKPAQYGALALIAVVAVIAVLLVIGVVNIIRSSAGSPEEKVAEPAATQSASAEPEETETAAVEPATDEEKAQTTVAVLNSSGVSGAAAKYGDAAAAAGWSVSELGNYQDTGSTSVVYYKDPEDEKIARALGADLGIAEVEESEEFAADVTAVIASDIAEDEPPMPEPGQGADQG